MRINELAWGGGLPLILLPLAAQAVLLLPRVLAGAMCVLVIAGVSGNLSWFPAWPDWLRNIAQATAAVVFVVVYVGVAQREREARQRAEALSAEVAQLATANERNRMAREIHDTLGVQISGRFVPLKARDNSPRHNQLVVPRRGAVADLADSEGNRWRRRYFGVIFVTLLPWIPRPAIRPPWLKMNA